MLFACYSAQLILIWVVKPFTKGVLKVDETIIVRVCDLCGSELPATDLARRIRNSKTGLLFCSRDHKNDALRAGIAGDVKFKSLIPSFYGKPRPKSDKIECEGCFKLYLPRNGQIYCTKRCSSKHKNRLKVEQWLSGDWDLVQTSDGSLKNWGRSYLMEQVHYACSICRWSEVSANNTIPLEIDHIDGNWKNSHPDNLRVLCPNCHACTHNYKVYNTGNDQSRYSYYKERGWW